MAKPRAPWVVAVTAAVLTFVVAFVVLGGLAFADVIEPERAGYLTGYHGSWAAVIAAVIGYLVADARRKRG